MNENILKLYEFLTVLTPLLILYIIRSKQYKERHCRYKELFCSASPIYMLYLCSLLSDRGRYAVRFKDVWNRGTGK